MKNESLEMQIKEALAKEPFGLQVKKIKKIKGGGTSDNYVCICPDEKFFIKVFLKNSERRAERLFKILKTFDEIPLLFEQTPYIKLEENILLIQKFLDGRQLRNADLVENIIDEISNNYKDYLKKCIKIETLSWPQSFPQTYIEQCLSTLNENSFFGKKIKEIIPRIAAKAPQLSEPTCLIHGDLTTKNFIFDPPTKKLTLIDAEGFRRGYVIEDFAKLVLNAVRNSSAWFFPEKKFATMVRNINKNFHFSKEEWLYGTVMYYLQSMTQRLRRKKFLNSWRKQLVYLHHLRTFETVCRIYDNLYATDL